MNKYRTLLVFYALLLPFLCIAQADVYAVDDASVEHAGVPKGEIIRFQFNQSKIFPGTTRDVFVYVPAQYNPDTPACVYVNQDGIQWNAPTVFDNLIASGEMPVTIGIFITPGVLMADSNAVAQNRFNRSFEYDGLGGNYARFLLNELFPEVEKRKTSNGRAIHLSKNGNDRAIGGSSSGATCAFTAAWEYPQEFSRVFSAIGSYVGLRGGDRYPTLVRLYEPKPIRIFLQDGSKDLDIYAGDWWMANQTLQRALAFAGYELNYAWGEGAHNGNHGRAIFPAAMRWLWKDWPKPITKGASENQFLSDLLIQDEDWNIFKGPLPFAGRREAMTPDHTQMLTIESTSNWITISKLTRNRSKVFTQRYGWLHVPDTGDDAGATTLQCDTAGRVFAGTRMGVQVLDQLGRVNAIIPLPGNAPVTALCFGGKNFDTLYVSAGDKKYYRKLRTRGSNSFDLPVKPSNPRL